MLRIPGFVPRFTPAQQQKVAALFSVFSAHPSAPPARTEAEALVGIDILYALIEQGQLVKLGDNVLFLRNTYEDAISVLVGYMREHGTMTVAEARDAIGTSRKYILPLLEHMDKLHITRRLGDERMLGSAQNS